MAIAQKAQISQDSLSLLRSQRSIRLATAAQPKAIIGIQPRIDVPRNHGQKMDQNVITMTRLQRAELLPNTNGIVRRAFVASPSMSLRS